MGLTKLPSPRPPVSPKVAEVLQAQIHRRSEANDPLWQEATTQLRHVKALRQLRAKRYRIEIWMTAFAVISVVAAALSMQLSIVHTTQAVDLNRSDMAFAVDVLRSIIATTTIFLYGLVLLRYDVVCDLRIASTRLHPTAKFYHPSAGLLPKALFECFILSLHVPPTFARLFISHRFMGSPERAHHQRLCAPGMQLDATGFCYLDLPWSLDQFDVVVFVRLYVVFRLLRHQLGFESPDIEWQGTQWHVQTSSFWFTIKHMFHKHPVLFSAMSFGATWLCTALVVQFLEHAINADIDSLSEALWLTVLTMATVGLGSAPPISVQGQVAIVIGGIVGGAIMNALLTTVLISSLHLTEKEDEVIQTIHARDLHVAHHQAAIRLLQTFGRDVLLRQATPKASWCTLRRSRHRIIQAATAFQTYRRRMRERSHEDVLEACHDKVEAIAHSGATSVERACMASLDAIEAKLAQVHAQLRTLD
ncbi:hypothetical protein SDRG_00714 [Saprolegnia diclina VS20]|uniref:Potassium channel domain-containing protein n=1 Tax=Saprolegnia diclina (strain VS20) TaxID=1156394 RepID=T0S957_SAPDV|nr:hypothetical protein SDRG_00714 [Saprolegnia diclina VS20]EQC41858.1 hypothetical protein SDRG_00714 [Saprolegnia diclina VS20]|eukprot:XP_008604427.1 hypothetical protein SDRG_00714 [Saprolegnia diclina VS20]